MKKELRSEAIRLRITERCSYSEIKKRLKIPKSTLSYWLRDLPLSEEEISKLQKSGWEKGESGRERYRNSRRKLREAKDDLVYQSERNKFKKVTSESLFIAGLMMYLCEGDKKNGNRIALANTDHKIIRFFILWLEKYFDVKREEVKIQLHLYEDMNIENEKLFWSEILSIDQGQFYKPSIRKLRPGSFTYSESFRHGTCSIYILGVERTRKLLMSIKAFLDST